MHVILKKVHTNSIPFDVIYDYLRVTYVTSDGCILLPISREQAHTLHLDAEVYVLWLSWSAFVQWKNPQYNPPADCYFYLKVRDTEKECR